MSSSVDRPTFTPVRVALLCLVIIVGLSFIASNISKGTNAKITVHDKSGRVHHKPIVTTKIESKTEPVPYGKETINDPATPQGSTYMQRSGVNGEKTYTYQVTYKDGTETDRALVNEAITRNPINEVTVVGTRVTWRCIDVTSYDYNWNNDMRCISSDGRVQYTSYSGARYLESL